MSKRLPHHWIRTMFPACGGDTVIATQPMPKWLLSTGARPTNLGVGFAAAAALGVIAWPFTNRCSCLLLMDRPADRCRTTHDQMSRHLCVCVCERSAGGLSAFGTLWLRRRVLPTLPSFSQLVVWNSPTGAPITADDVASLPSFYITTSCWRCKKRVERSRRRRRRRKRALCHLLLLCRVVQR